MEPSLYHSEPVRPVRLGDWTIGERFCINANLMVSILGRSWVSATLAPGSKGAAGSVLGYFPAQHPGVRSIRLLLKLSLKQGQLGRF